MPLPVRLDADAVRAGEALIRCPHCDNRIDLALLPATDTLGAHVNLGLRLTRTEGTLFDALHGEAGSWMPKKALQLAVWGTGGLIGRQDGRHLLRQTIFRLRAHLSGTGWAVETLPATGYRLVPPPAPAPIG